MRNFLDKIFLRSNNLDKVSKKIKNLNKVTPIKKIFEAITSYSLDGEIRYVGGCVRKILSGEEVDDIDMATNLSPDQVCSALKKKDIEYFETGIEHGTVTALINGHKFEITSLREDISTDGRHAKVRFSKDWKKDATRRDFTINSIYSDYEGNLFDPFNGKKDLEAGIVNFIGDADKRIKEDYLRILRYLRFFSIYSNQPHSVEIIKNLKINIKGTSKLSKERLLDELIKISKLETLEKLTKNKFSLEIILLVFPELKNIHLFSNLTSYKKKILIKSDFIFLLSLMIIDDTDNSDYFLYRFNISKKDQKRIRNISNFLRENKASKVFTEKNMNKFFYFKGKEALIDILNFKIIKSKKFDEKLINLRDFYLSKEKPVMPISADTLMVKYKIPEGRHLGVKLKILEDKWVDNNFKISDQEVDHILKG